MINSLKKFADIFNLEINHIDDTITVRPLDNSAIDFEEKNPKIIFQTLAKIYGQLFENNKIKFPYLLTGEKSDDLLLLPLEEYICCCEERNDGREISMAIYFDCEPEEVPLLSYREIFRSIFKLYVKKARQQRVQ